MSKKKRHFLPKKLNFKIIIYFIGFAYLPLLIFSILGYYLNKDMITRINLDNLRVLNLGYANKINAYMNYNSNLVLNNPGNMAHISGSDFEAVVSLQGEKEQVLYSDNDQKKEYHSLPYIEFKTGDNTKFRGYLSVYKLQDILNNDLKDFTVNLYFINSGQYLSKSTYSRLLASSEIIAHYQRLNTKFERESWHQMNENKGLFSAFTYFPEWKILIETQIDANTFYAELNSFRNKILLANMMLALILLGLAWYYSRQITTPIYKLIEAVQHIGRGKLENRIDVESNDEIRILASEFELMRQKLLESHQKMEEKINLRTQELQGAQAQIMHQEKMASLGLMAAGIAHEIGNPLTSISSMAQIIKRKTNDEKTIEYVSSILKNIERISRIVRELVDFSKPTTYKAAPAEMNEIIKSAVGIVKYDRRSKNIAYTLDLADNLPKITVVADHMLQVFLNILINAVDASEGLGDVINVATRYAEKQVIVEVRDQGCGIPDDKLNKIFEPFYTTKDVGKGTGLGLTVSYGLIKKLKGEIRVKSQVNKGSTFMVVLPISIESQV